MKFAKNLPGLSILLPVLIFSACHKPLIKEPTPKQACFQIRDNDTKQALANVDAKWYQGTGWFAHNNHNTTSAGSGELCGPEEFTTISLNLQGYLPHVIKKGQGSTIDLQSNAYLKITFINDPQIVSTDYISIDIDPFNSWIDQSFFVAVKDSAIIAIDPRIKCFTWSSSTVPKDTIKYTAIGTQTIPITITF